MSDKQMLFSLYLEGRLTSAQQAEFDALCEQDEALAARVATAGWVKTQAEQYQEQPVPSWDPARIMPRVSTGQRWWQWSGMAPLSMAMSVFALALILLRVEVLWQNDSLTISFAGKGRQMEIEQQVASQLADFKTQQESLLVQRVKDWREEQQQVNSQFATYLLSASRTERREDFAELIKYVNEQREDDQLFYARQLNQLQDEIQTSADGSVTAPIRTPEQKR
ncbi:hypothetical protein P2G88_01750 [Aliiglaciecola sp. CAU 1673]|uniref:hypothetical protein n=1 Tax=Aliiglaciecola sp. CAU 1673 TaxID=3032595 RepID=UPI0023DAF501|nr:hypothetical protein [Aliiglaciecola sp. CAU 1673]MDF2176977.1 hypothetical protein [Aliiglaciecola sp. CAU 1673]